MVKKRPKKALIGPKGLKMAWNRSKYAPDYRKMVQKGPKTAWNRPKLLKNTRSVDTCSVDGQTDGPTDIFIPTQVEPENKDFDHCRPTLTTYLTKYD